ncbi:MAG: peptidylprolyl isomerase [Nitrosomonadales bacterium]|nr:peptidylprolyl isomerase [Nitrosomonadales bacterium]
MWNRNTLLTCLFTVALVCSPLHASAADQVMATVGDETINSHELEQAVSSSPFYTQFNTMGEDEQASLRGDMLRRLVAARLLALEARRLGMDKTPSFQREKADFRQGLLYRGYMNKLRVGIAIPADTLEAMKQQFKGDADAFEAAKSAYLATQFQPVKRAEMLRLQQDSHAKSYEQRIKPGIKPATVLMEGDGFSITYGDIVDAEMQKKRLNPEWVRQQLKDRSEVLLVSMAAERDGANVTSQIDRYVEERLPAMMLEKKTGEWVPNEKSLRNWYVKHPEIGRIPVSYHVGQIVVATREQAEALSARIVKGESLFDLAGSESIDPVGRKQNGDIGWITEGRGVPELMKVLPTLKDEQISEVVSTPSGFHLIVVLERRIGKQKPFGDVRERVKQMMVNQNLPAYLGELEKRYPVTWNVMATQAASQPVATQ